MAGSLTLAPKIAIAARTGACGSGYVRRVQILGRTAELAWLQELVDEARSRSHVALIEAAPGAGKSTVLSCLVEAAQAAGATVLRCAPTAVEQAYDYAALGDLLRDIIQLDHVDPGPRSALLSALLRGPTDSASIASVDPRAVGVGLVQVLAELAAHGLTLVVVDDVHWLDQATEAALSFALRRMPTNNVVVVGARRAAVDGPTLPTMATPLEPLSDEALTNIVTGIDARGGRRLVAREVRAIVAHAAGNPMFAIELARHASGMPPSSEGRLQLPDSLSAVVAQRLDGQDDEMLEALAAVALAAQPDVALIERLGVTPHIEVAERFRLVDTSTGRVLFTHPLISAAVVDRCTPAGRRAIHGRLAAAVIDRSDAVFHSCRAATGTNGELAVAAADEAAACVGRGAGDRAADLAVLAAELTPLGDIERHARYVNAAHLSFQRGDGGEALRLLDEVGGLAASRAALRTEHMTRAIVGFSVGSGDERDHALRALEACDTDPERIEVQTLLARVSYDDFDVSAAHARAAYELAQGCALEPMVEAQLLCAYAGESFMAGAPLDEAMFARAIELEQDHVLYIADSALASFAALLKIDDQLDRARTLLTEMLARNDDDGATPFVLSHLPQIELWTGNWDAAEDYANRHLDAALRAGQQDQAKQARNNLAQVDLMRGDVDGARQLADELLAVGIANGDMWTERNALGLLGLVALADGDAESAVAPLRRWHELAEHMHLRQPGYCRLRGDLVEALVATGRMDEATAMVERMRTDAERGGRPTVHAAADRAAALVAAASGERTTALSQATRSVQLFAQTELVFEHARSLLTLGQIHRRFKEKSAARHTLQAALDVFVRLGATRFAERCRQDLQRVGLRPGASTDLTATETRVAHLAADGRTVRQMADELFISPKTVEANLTRVYRKLGVSGRAELAKWALGEGVTSR